MNRVVGIAACLLAATVATGQVSQSSSQTFRISLQGERETTPGDMNGIGFAVVTVDGPTLHYFLWVAGIDSPTASHVHRGSRGESGPVAVGLSSAFESAGSGTFWAAGSTVADAALLSAIAQDPQHYYVNVHNGAYPDGALRGQVLGDGPSTIALATDLSGDRERPVLGDPGGAASRLWCSPTIGWPTTCGRRTSTRRLRPTSIKASVGRAARCRLPSTPRS